MSMLDQDFVLVWLFFFFSPAECLSLTPLSSSENNCQTIAYEHHV